MAQSNNGWSANQYGNGMGSIGGGSIGLNSFNTQPYQDPTSPTFEDNPPYLNQHSYQYQAVPGNNHLGPQNQTYEYYENTPFQAPDSNSSGLHGHGVLGVQQYADPNFDSFGPSQQQSQFQAQYTPEQPVDNFGRQWQGSLQQAPGQYSQGTVAYNHSAQTIYPRGRPMVYESVRNPSVVQGAIQYNTAEHSAPAGIYPNVLNSLKRQDFDTRPPQQYHIQQHNPDGGYGDDGTSIGFGSRSSSAQGFQGMQHHVPMIHPHSQSDGQVLAAPSNQPANPADGISSTMGYQTLPTANLATVPMVNHSITPDNPHLAQNVGPQASDPMPEATNGTGAWEQVPGCQNLFAKNSPKIRIGKFSEIRTSEKPFVAKHNRSQTPCLPQRGFRLPCEIQRDRDELSSRLQYPLTDSEKESINQEIAQLDNERIILAEIEGSKFPPQDTKPKAITKRKSPNMDPTIKKSGPPGSGGDDEENVVDSVARKVISTKTRPADLVKGVEYDVIKILWRDPKLAEPSKDAVLNNVTAFGDYFTDLWDKTKELKKELETPKDGNDKAALQSLQSALDDKYDTIRVAIEAAVKYGDNFTITQLGIHLKMLGGLCFLLRHRFLAEDYNGPLPKAILKLMSMFITVDTDFLTSRVKLDKLRQKYNNNLDEEGEDYMDQIFANAKNRSELKAREDANKSDDVKKSNPGIPKKASLGVKDTLSTSKASATKKEVPPKKTIPEVKKMQPTDYSGLGSARKISSVTAKVNSAVTPSKRSRDEDVDPRVPKKIVVEIATGGPSTAKPQSTPITTAPTPQTPSVASTLSRSRPTGSMLPGRSRVPAKAPPKKPAPQSTASAIGDLLAQISKPKEAPKQREEPEKVPETPEERARRLRKESRRHLRVSWKPDHELTDIRTFEHDMAEDKGRDQNMLRDARDNRSEGQMLKQRVQDNDDDDEEEKMKEEKEKEVDLRHWSKPQTVDFRDITPEQRAKNYVTRGGDQIVTSEQRKALDEYESRVLMAIYTSVAELPESPRSPSRVNELAQQQTAGSQASEPSKWQESLPLSNLARQETHRRWTNAYSGYPATQHSALQRLSISTSNSPFGNSILQTTQAQFGSHANPPTISHQGGFHSYSASRPQTQEERDAEVLALLKSDKVKNWVNPEPYDAENPKTQRRFDYADPKVQQAADALEVVFAQFKGKPFPPTEPPEHIKSDPLRVQEWQAGWNHDMAAKARSQENDRAVRFPEQTWNTTHTQGSQPSQLVTQANPYTTYQPYTPQPQTQPLQYHQQAQQPSPNYAAILEQVRVIQAGQSASQPSSQLVVQPTQAATATPQALASVQDVLARLGQSQQAASVPQTALQTTPAPAQTAPDYGNWQAWAQTQAHAYGNQQQPYNAQSYNSSQPQTTQTQTQAYNGHGYHDESYTTQTQSVQSQRESDRGSRKDFHRGSKDKGINRALIGTKPCTFWAKGQCAKGDKCTFRHDPNDLK
ncbi:hypothetical protein AAE478_006521 [Parahypoxylon ruwenzoriense]